MIDAGSHGLCILANFSEQFVLTDAEREQVMHAVLEHVAGRVPVIVTTTHFGSRVCAERSRQAQDAGAAMVMVMPPYHGATLPRAGKGRSTTSIAPSSDAIDIPIMIQDAPVAGTPLSVDLLARMARDIEQHQLLQDRGADGGGQAARPDRRRRRQRSWGPGMARKRSR